MAPASGPNINTAAKTNVSETERYAVTAGTLTEKDPVRIVRAARISHCLSMGLASRAFAEWARVAVPNRTTSATYALTGLFSVEKAVIDSDGGSHYPS